MTDGAPLHSDLDVAEDPLGFRFRTDDPDELTQAVAMLAPGIEVRAHSRSFGSRVRAWRLSGAELFTYSAWGGCAVFGESRPYAAFTLPLFGSFSARHGSHHAESVDGLALASAPGERSEVTPAGQAHLLGLAVPADRFAEQWRAAHGRWGGAEPRLAPFVSTTSPAGRRLAAHLNWMLAELNRSGPLVRDARVAEATLDQLLGLLAEVCEIAPVQLAKPPSEFIARRAEDFLAEHLDQPMSLTEVAKALSLSTRSLTRAFEKRQGMGPMAFRRRRRFEAARRDLFVADRAQISVTDVALRYGFFHLGRFSAGYRKIFGESPSDSLRA